MATAARASIEINATDKTGAAFASLTGKLKGAQAGIETLAARFAGVQAAFAGALGGAGLVAFVKGTVDAIDALNDVADATGSTIENLSALEGVARRNGGTLDDVSGILVKFNQALNAADGKNGTSRALQAIGLDAKQLRDLDPADALRKTAVALAGFADDGNKARITQELFGKSIREAAPFLKDLAEAGTLNARVTTEQAKEAEVFNKQLAAMNANFGDIARTMGVAVLPALNAYAEKLKNLPSGANIFGVELVSEVQAARLAIAVAKVEDLQEALAKSPGNRGIAQALSRARADADALLASATSANTELKKLLGADFASLPQASYSNEGRNYLRRIALPPQGDDGLKKRAAEFEDYAQTITKSVAGLFADADLSRLERVNAQLAELDTRWAGADPAKLTEVRRKLLEERTKLEELIAKPIGLLNTDEETPPVPQSTLDRFALVQDLSGAAKLRDQTKQFDMLAEAFKRGEINLEQLGTMSAKVAEDLDQIPQKFDEMGTFAEQAARNIQDTLGDSLTRMLDGDFKSIGDMWSSLLKKMVAQALAAQLNKYLFGSGPLSGEGLLGGLFGSILGIGKRAAGGPVTAGTPYLVGERGPEIVVPRAAGTVVPNGAIGGSSITHVYQVAAGVQRNELMTALQITSQAIEGRIMGALRVKGVV